jgi:rRNA maturation endonuclease Nob1
MDKELPLYKITIEEEYSEGEDLGIDMIAFTSKPAVMVKGMAFNSAQIFHFKDEPKMRIVAPAMIPMNIYRNDEGEEYYVQFTEQEIENIYSKFMQDLNNQNLFNLEHTDKKVPAYILEAWLVENPKEDKAFSSYGIEVPKGTLMLTAQITDKEYYNKLVESDQVGFSIEGFLGLKLSNQINKYNMKLPDGEHLIEGKIYVVKDGEVIEIKEEVPAEMEAELAAEEVVEEEEIEAEEVAAAEVEEKVEEEIAMAVDVETDSEAVLAIVQPVLDALATELMKAIAEVKALIPVSEEVEEEEVELSEQKFTAIDRLKKYRQLFKEN